MLNERNLFYPYEDFNQGLTPQNVLEFQKQVRAVITSPDAIVDQKKEMLVDVAFKTLPYPPISKEAYRLIEEGKICLLGEGPAPFHPRYTAPDYLKMLQQGSAFFDLKPAQSIFDVVDHLITLYQYAPSSGLPVYLGNLDELFEPYLDSVSEETAYAVMKSFWRMVDRLHPNGFVHADLGPQVSRAGRMLMEIDREERTVTNLTLRYDPERTAEDFALQAVANTLELTKPYFVNHKKMAEAWGEDYVMASCFNPMKLAGGIFTLVRLNLKELLAGLDCSMDTILNEIIPETAALQMEIINSRINYLVEEVRWFEHSPFVKEGLLDKEKFSAYAGVYGMNEAVNTLMETWGKSQEKYGHSEQANLTAEQIAARLKEELHKHPSVYCTATDQKAAFHAQVGISSDQCVSPGVRFPAGQEPPLYQHMQGIAPQHELFSGGISTIIEFDQTARSNPQAVLDLIKGAHKMGLRNLSVGSCDSEYIRVSGYLIRRADLEKSRQERLTRLETNSYGNEFMSNQPESLHRRVRKV
ncbi:MAG: YjjI family glycine radical enzyme [Anaerolineaceae bacterium]|nr:YjjI family glycine radical enzyme [Anaerolineaceae bacterium]